MEVRLFRLEDAGTWSLPVIGTNWMKNCADKYLLINPLMCARGAVCYWTCEFVTTGDFFYAGIFKGECIRKELFRFNNGVDIVAVPLTYAALRILHKIDTDDETAFDVFANVLSCDVIVSG